MNKPAILSRAQVRRVDQVAVERFAISGLVLMENAGRATADLLEQLGIEGRVLICCGTGNNGGDGFVLARQLDGRGYNVEVIVSGPDSKLRGDAAANFEVIQRSGISCRTLVEQVGRRQFAEAANGADWVVDALLGTGARGEPRAPLDRAIAILNEADTKRLAIDLPSGLDADSGEASGAVFRADHTATFVAEKPGFAREPGCRLTGVVHVLGIGLPSAIWELDEFRRPSDRG